MNKEKPFHLADENQQAGNIRHFLSVVQKHLWWIAAIVVIVVGIVASDNLMAIPIYRASVQILIDPDEPKVVEFEKVLETKSRLTDYYTTQYKLIQSRALLKRVVEELNLSSVVGFGVPRKREQFSISEVSKAWLRKGFQYIRSLVEKESHGESLNSSALKKINPEKMALGALMGGVTVKPVRRSRLVVVHFDWPDRIVAVQVANKIGELYIEENLNSQLIANRNASKWLKKEIQEAQKALDQSEQNLQKYKEKYNIVSLEDRRNIVAQKLIELNSTLTKIKTQALAKKALVTKIQSINGNLPNLASLPDVIGNSVLQEIRKGLISLQHEKSELIKRYKKSHPKLIRINSKIASMQQKVKEEIREIANSILISYQVLREQEKEITKSFNAQKNEALRLDRLAIQYQNLSREVEANQKLNNTMLKRWRETGILAGLKTTNIRIVDRAETPESPIRPRKFRNILLALGSSVIFGLVFVFFLENLDNRIKSPDDVESIIGAPTVGVLPELGKKITQRDPLLRMEGEYQAIGREHFHNLETMISFCLNGDTKVIQVSSCIPNEGKSFVACNLALAMSEIKEKVLLIDGDLKRPKMNEIFENVPAKGLTQLLRGKIELNEAIWRVPESSLGLIPAGETSRESSKLLGHANLAKLKDDLKQHFDYIIVDSPPFLAVNDPIIWSRGVDCLLLVVDLQQVNPKMLRQVAGLIQPLDVEILGTVSNRLTHFGSYYYYGYDSKSRRYYS